MPTTKPLADGVLVSFTLEPDTIIGETYRQTGEDDYAPEPVTLLDAVVDRLAATMVERTERAISDRYLTYSGIVSSVVEPRVEAKIEEIVEAALTLELARRPADPFGAAPVEARTLEDVITDRVDRWLKENVQQGSGYGSRTTRVDAILSKIIDREFTAALDKVIKDARAKALAAVSQVAEKSLTDALRTALSQKTGV